jgi:hypothetical protein
MANFTITPNMNLISPIPGVDPGPDYATNQASTLSIIDGHTHTPGSGVLITPAAMNINSDLSMNGNNLNLVKTVNYKANSGSLAGSPPNLGCTYVGGNELYYNDEAGNVVQITNNGSVNAGAGSITGLPSGTASASYNSGSETFVWQSATNTPANMDGGSFIFRDISASSKGVTVNAPSGLAADYSLNWPSSLPASTKIVTIDTSGNIAAVYDVDNVTLEVSSNLLQIKPDGGITGAMIGSKTVTIANISGPAIQQSASSGTYFQSGQSIADVTNLTVTITSTGNPIVIGLTNDNSDNGSAIALTDSAANATMDLFLIRSGTTNSVAHYAYSTLSLLELQTQAPSVLLIDPIGAGTYTYKISTRWSGSGGGGTGIAVNFYSLYAYEMLNNA